MNILLLEPFYTGSHKAWADGFKKYSSHQVTIVTLPGAHWKWRMHGAAVTMASLVPPTCHNNTDLIIATDMLDLSVFLALTKSWSSNIPVVLYFHENQLTYPWSKTDEDVHLKRDNHYAFINYTSALAADKVFFNSNYHRQSFLQALTGFTEQFPDYRNTKTITQIEEKSEVLRLGLDFEVLQQAIPLNIDKPRRAVVLWNHRWEYDKNPEEFFEALIEIHNRGIDFNLVVLGQSYGKQPGIFEKAKAELKEHILHWGYCKDYKEYVKWMSISDILPVTSIQDFFGISVLEAMFCNVVPLLPRRLAYTEHIPETYHRTFFYEEGELITKLQRRIMDVKYVRVMDTRQYALKYHWISLVNEYDRKFEQIGALHQE